MLAIEVFRLQLGRTTDCFLFWQLQHLQILGGLLLKGKEAWKSGPALLFPSCALTLWRRQGRRDLPDICACKRQKLQPYESLDTCLSERTLCSRPHESPKTMTASSLVLRTDEQDQAMKNIYGINKQMGDVTQMFIK